MQLGMVGLGRMGANLVRRLMRDGHRCVGYARTEATVQALASDGMIGASSLADLVMKLERPRTIWLMVPVEAVQSTLDDLVPLLDPDDVVIDGGNTYYRDDIVDRRGPAECGRARCGRPGRFRGGRPLRPHRRLVG